MSLFYRQNNSTQFVYYDSIAITKGVITMFHDGSTLELMHNSLEGGERQLVTSPITPHIDTDRRSGFAATALRAAVHDHDVISHELLYISIALYIY